ncbi:shikimate dehydrogenase [Polycladidibacter stylochi]|uniref:shikimate dehydrogenase n=1 Tax=Polycladidibacter stylochi TaxID=1807766 RepID=UPI0008308AD2|nr:shikimate dehydrogenase [Pseudovibrio stylochi]
MRKAAITGYPLSHSKSPVIHGYWLKKYGLQGEYGVVEVAPETAIDFYENLSRNNLIGCNVTIPNKESAFKAAAQLDDAAKAIGAVNTLWLDENSTLNGSNTDALGFLGNLDQNAPGWDSQSGDNCGKKAVVLGAGGAARAIIWALLQRGFKEIHIINRTAKRAEELADHFGRNIFITLWENREKELHNCQLLVNTTSLGMKGQPNLELSLDNLSKSAVVTDIVYAPLMTDLLKSAQDRGNTVVDGLGMLLHQAVPGFEQWFGVKPEVTAELRQLVIEQMES